MANENEPAKLLFPYLQRADELQKHDPLVAYYCRLYAMERGFRIPQKERTKTTNALLVSLINQLEKDRKSLTLGPDDYLHVEGFASNVFQRQTNKIELGGPIWILCLAIHISKDLEPNRSDFTIRFTSVTIQPTITRPTIFNSHLKIFTSHLIFTSLSLRIIFIPSDTSPNCPTTFLNITYPKTWPHHTHTQISNPQLHLTTLLFTKAQMLPIPLHRHLARLVILRLRSMPQRIGMGMFRKLLKLRTMPKYEYDSNYQPPPEQIVEAHKAARFAVGALAFDDVSVAVEHLKKSLELLTRPSARR
ncbi:Protein HOMOLOG OF MAMMALIAN LYST-INTERACTING PROTEIN 5 [Striga hermonthica]|uniref:Protein HOMOLOG OF MAMMALIAN LYST-INTERACTING PROTEIN 5 n=1 Tax=Striga hermonthica TaxID=68872 RepID=A0A9N7MHR5_STRHE|nr:Protein HOMOLOG OF MAMMALIAN LYST-INTERACTING PROTEIN 5 [Striga hermonthica]